MPINSLLNLITYNKKMLWLILLCNILGTLYGYIWYGGQLSVTDWQYKIFVPDSPTASLFLCIVLIAYLFDKNLPITEALAFVTLIKYGVWAVIMNIIMFIEYNNITIVGCMLIMSHGIMAVEALLFYRRFKITIIGFIVAMIWAFHNDIIDYVFMQYPYYDFIESHLASVAYLAFWLSVIPLLLYLVRLKQCKTFDHS